MQDRSVGRNVGCGMKFGIVRNGKAEWVTCSSVLECQRRILEAERGVDIYERIGLGCAGDINQRIFQGLRI